MLNDLKVFLFIVLYFSLNSTATAQVSLRDLKSLLSASDQKNLEKIENLFNKGNSVADEANKLKPDTNDKETAKKEKKYTLKRLEASQYYQKANSRLSSLLKVNIGSFRKKNKDLPPDQTIKNKEDHAVELLRQARSTRGVAEDLTYPDEKLSKILEAENIEKEANDILVKVLYACLNRPLAYDELKYSPVSDSVGNSSETADVRYLQPETSLQEKNSAIYPHDTLPSHQDDSIKNSQVEKPVNAPEKIASRDTSSLYGMVNVNEDQVDKFNKFLQVSYPDAYANYIIDFRNLNYRDIESLREAWHHYLYAGNDEILQKNPTSVKDTIQQYAVSDNSLQVITSPQGGNKQDTLTEKAVKIALSDKHQTKKNKTDKLKKTNPDQQVKEDQKSGIVLSENPSEDYNAPAVKGFLYRVQISACRIPLDSVSLKSVYNGSFPVLMLREDEWYKYAVGEFETYREARSLKDRIRVPGAFVIAYLNGKRISIPKPDDMVYTGNSGITYKVQIIAAKKQLDKDYIRHIYSGNQTVEEICEEGWYKYAIVVGASLDEAKKLISRENIPGAFITSYLGDKKVELKDAIRLEKSKSIK